MANNVTQKGLVPLRFLSGAAWDGAYSTYVVLAADTNMISPGDAVKSFAGADANGVPAVTKALGTDVCRGVVIGVLPAGMNNPSLIGVTLDLATQNIPATKLNNYYVAVVDDPNVVYSIAEDGTAYLPGTSANKNISLTVNNPTAPRQNSGTTLNNSSAAVTATLPFKLLGLLQRADNTFGLNAQWVVKFNTHEFLGSTAGA